MSLSKSPKGNPSVMKTLKIYSDEHNEKSEVGYSLTNLRILSLVDDVVLIIIVTAVYNNRFFFAAILMYYLEK